MVSTVMEATRTINKCQSIGNAVVKIYTSERPLVGRAFVARLQGCNSFLSRSTYLKINFFVLVGTLFDSTTNKMYFPFTSQQYFIFSIK
jgi:hypothetical protein